MSTKNTDWYSNRYDTIEIATLCGDLYFEHYEDLRGNFNVQVLTPSQRNSDELKKTTTKAPKPKGAARKALNTSSYKMKNALELTIPAHILPSFTVEPYDEAEGIFEIPSGSKFVVGIIGASTDPENIRIIGTYTDKEHALSQTTEEF